MAEKEVEPSEMFSTTGGQTANIERWSRLIENESAMVLPAQQQAFFSLKIKQRMQLKHLSNDQYFQLVVSDANERKLLVESVMIHQSRFFRDPVAFEVVRQHLVGMREDPLIWSVGCSTGEEVWSLAMLAEQAGKSQFKLIATDISQPVLDTAERAMYPQSKLAQLPEAFQRIYVQSQQGTEQFSIRKLKHWDIHFSCFNLKSDFYPYRLMDVIFCQNVLIYFRMFERKDFLRRMVSCLKVGGIVVLGLGEVDWHHPDMKKIELSGSLAYERIR